jgi:hypothetical protein
MSEQVLVSLRLGQSFHACVTKPAMSRTSWYDTEFVSSMIGEFCKLVLRVLSTAVLVVLESSLQHLYHVPGTTVVCGIWSSGYNSHCTPVHIYTVPRLNGVIY